MQRMGEHLRRARILCTVGPASREPATLRALVEAGADGLRVNFAHSSHEEAATVIGTIRDIARDIGRPLAVLVDLQGPKVRVGDLQGSMAIHLDQTYRFVPEGHEVAELPAQSVIPTTYSGLAQDLEPGARVLLDDGRLAFEVVRIDGDVVEARALVGGELASNKGINLPGVTVQTDFLTKKDRADLEFAESNHVDYVGLSFVQRARDLRRAREAIGGEALIVAKIEKAQALVELEDIIRLSDGVMVARGDLGVELPFEDVPMVQKRIIRLGRELARPVITATQMLESMTGQPRPTRAEVSDVANTLLDGTDVVMLSAETAIGDYPVEAVQAMDRIIRRIEGSALPGMDRAGRMPGGERAQVQKSASGAISAAAVEAVERLGASCIVTLTRSGFTARVVASQRPPVPILAITDQWRTYNQLALVWGVQPLLYRGELSFEGMRDHARKEVRRLGLGSSGDRYVVTAGVPFHVAGTTNLMRIEQL